MLGLLPCRHRSRGRVHALARALPDAARAELAALTLAGTFVDLPDGHVLMEEGEWVREAFLVLEGLVDVCICGSVITTLGPGEIVGELAVLDGRRPRMATVRAAGPVRALRLDAAAYHRVAHLPGLAATMAPTARYVTAA